MAYTSINKSSDYFDTKLYTQTGTTNNGDTQTITMDNVGMAWIKNRSYTNAHALFDIIRGGDKLLVTSSTGAEETIGGGLTFGASETTIGGDTGGYGFNNRVGDNYVAWHWRTDGTTGSSNTDGSITSTVSVNTTSGFSIVKYTGTASNATVGHGLGVKPAMMIAKNLDNGSEDWCVYHKSLGYNNVLKLHSSNAILTATNRWNAEPDTSVFNVGTAAEANGSGANQIAYVFAEKKGFSKFGSYIGNGNADGTFVYTGFKPAFLLYKCSTDIFTNWQVFDNKRSTYNLAVNRLNPNDNSAELATTADSFDLLSNGFKARNNGANSNNSGSTFIYMAFAENPLVSSTGVPCTAR